MSDCETKGHIEWADGPDVLCAVCGDYLYYDPYYDPDLGDLE